MGSSKPDLRIETWRKTLQRRKTEVEKLIQRIPSYMIPAQERQKMIGQVQESIEKMDSCLEKNGKGWDGQKKKIFSIEKKIVPLLKDNTTLSEELSCNTLISSCALDKEPAILCALIMKPQKVYFFHTYECSEVARSVESEISATLPSVDVVMKRIGGESIKDIYAELGKIVYGRKRSTENIVFDVTPTIQPLTFAFSVFSTIHKIPAVYLHRKQLFLGGDCLTVPFSQTIRLAENPVDFFGDTGMSMLEQQFNSHLYEAALKDCRELISAVRDLGTKAFLELLERLFELYRDWDLFHHSTYFDDKEHVSILGKHKNSWLEAALKNSGLPSRPLSLRLQEIVDEFKKFGLEDCLPRGWNKNLEFLKGLDENWRNSKNITDEYRLVDNFVNALRRGSAKQGKYDDAVGRLYRCMEMCATIKLVEAGLGYPDKPDYKNFAKKNRLDMAHIKRAFQGKGKELPNVLALDDQMTLLSLIKGDKLAKIYDNMKATSSGMESVMYRRNYSILAHGTLPLTEEDWVRFRDGVRAAIIETIGRERFGELYEGALHGEIKIT